MFWTAADAAYNLYVFNKAMEKIGSYNPKAFEYLEKCTEQWSRHQFHHEVFCDNTTNFVESFNAITKAYKDLPVLTVLEAVRSWCMKRIGFRFDTAADMSPQQLSDYASNILEVRGEESRLCYVTACGGGEFEVKDEHVHFPIKLSTGICGCGKWQLSGIPYKHAVRVIYHQRLEPADFVPHTSRVLHIRVHMDNICTQCLIKVSGILLTSPSYHHLSLKDLLAGLANKEKDGQLNQGKERETSQSSATSVRRWATM